MAIFSIWNSLLIRKRQKFRSQFATNLTANEVAMERIVKVTTATTILFVFLNIISIPYLVSKFVMQEQNRLDDLYNMLKYAGLVQEICFVCNLPVSLFMFSWLSKRFRNTTKKALRCGKRQQETNTETHNQTE